MKTKEKKFVGLFVFLLFVGLLRIDLYSQTYDSTPLDRQELERYYDQYNNIIYERDYPGSTDNFAYVGKNATSSATQNTFRMIYTWVHSIPATATITSCTLYIAQTVTSDAPIADPPYVEFQFKEFPNNKYSSSPLEQWDAITTSNVRRTEQVPRSPGNYYTPFIMDQNFLNYIKNTLSTNRLHVAFRATDETNFGSNRNVHLLDFKRTPDYNVLSAVRIVITYTVPASIVNLTAQNNFPSGKIFVDEQEKDSPYGPFPKTVGEALILKAKEQNDNLGYPRIWNDIEAPMNKSKWIKNSEEEISLQIEHSFPVTQGDNNSIYEAGLRKNYRIDQKHKFEFGADILQPNPGFIVEQNSGSITAPLTSPSGNKTGTFSFWTDGITTRTRNVTLPTDNQTYTAFYKLNNYASSTTSYDKDGQKKSLMPWGAYDSGNWKVYESSGQIWLEKNGVVVNGGLPVNNLSDGPEAKSPSMDYVILSNWYSDIFVVYQQKTSNGKYKIKLAKFNGYGQKIYTYDVLTSTMDFATFDATPVISVTRNPDQANGKTKFNIVWRQKAEGSYQNGIYFMPGMDNGTNITWYYLPPTKVNSTDISSINPTMTAFKSPCGAAFLYHLAWQQGTTKIKYRAIADNWNGSASGGVTEIGSVEEPSYGDGWETNIEPSITVLNTGTGINYGVYYYDSPKLVWKSDYAVTHRSKTSSSWSAFYNYYANDDISSANISAAIEEQTYVITWAELEGYYNRYIKSTNLSSQILTGTHGKDIQVSNYGSFEWGFDINVFNNMTGTSAPFSFQTFSVQDGLNKANNFIAKEGRFGTVMKNDAEFYFGMGDVTADNNMVNFVELNDTLVITTND